MTSTKAVLIPGDVPPSESALKRQLLFFDTLLVPEPNDAAIVNRQEVVETFPDGYTLKWGSVGPYPRSIAYDEQYRILRARADLAVRRGRLQFLPLVARSPQDASNNWVSAAAAMKKETLLKAALPDYSVETEAAAILNSNVGGNIVVPGRTGYDSAYLWMTNVDAQPVVPMDELWRRVAMGRLGRAFKTIRRATDLGAIPLALDATNKNICLAVGASAYGDLPSPTQLSSAAVALDAVDPVALDAALETLSWSEVFRVRKEVLPAVAKLRGLLVESVRTAGKPQNASIEPYLAALKELRARYQKAQDDVSAAWRKIGIKTAEASMGAGSAGLTALAPNPACVSALVLVAGGLILKAAQGSLGEAETIVRGRKAVRASPLFAFDGLVRLGSEEIKREGAS